MKRAWWLAASLLLVAGGVWFALTPSPAQEVVAAFRADAGVSFTECRDDACLESAEARCTPAHLAKTLHTTEGVAVEVDRFVIRGADGCGVTELADYTKDVWGGCVVRLQRCPSLDALRSGHRILHGCGESTVIFTVDDCSTER